MKTVEQIITWLNTQGHIKCVLADITEVGEPALDKETNQLIYTTTTVKLSSAVYNTLDSNGVAAEYLPIITGGLNFQESLSIEGNISSSFGALELENTGGTYDYLLKYVWKRRSIKIYLGDITWQKQDFVLIFDGLVDDLVSNNENSLVISLFDKLQRLNDNITEKTLGSTQYNQGVSTSTTKDTVLPLLFGEAFNIEPLFLDTGTTQVGPTGTTQVGPTGNGYLYMYNNASSAGVIEVRDNGSPVDIKEDLATGTFRLKSIPAGTITCSAKGYNANTIPEIITGILTQSVPEKSKFSTSEISFGDFTNTSKVGIYCKDRVNILEVCSQLAKSVSAGLVSPSITITRVNASTRTVNSSSKLRLVELKVPELDEDNKTYTTLIDSGMVEGSLSVSETFPVRTVIKLAYCKNYTVQELTATPGINPTVTYAEEYLYSSKTNTDNQTVYKDNGTIDPEPTLLLETAAAVAEVEKRLKLWSKQRFLYTATYLPEYIFTQLGDLVKITSKRFNLDKGEPGIVFSINRDWLTGFIQIGVLV
jgi:hypothetical protein